MIDKYILNGFKYSFINKLPVRNSALFVNGLKATETYVHITPQVNFPNNVEKEQIKNDLLKRHSLFDFNKLENVWAMYEELKQRKICYEEERSKTSSELTKLMKDSSDNDKVNKLKIQCNLIKENIKMLKKPFLSAELTAMVELLKLPNKLHSKVSGQENIIHTHLLIPKSNKNHLEIGRQLNIITFKRNENYYLLRDAAIFELGAKFHLSKILRQRKFTQFSNNDFVKSVVVEGCGEDHTNPKSTFILQHDEASKVNIDNRLHLTGAGSLTSFFAYHAKNVIYSKVLPLKYFTLGRQYSPSPSDEDSLFHVSQSSVVQLFEVLKDDVEQENAFQEVIDIVKDFYNDLGYHYRLNLLPANKLLMWESLRLSIEMFSSSLNNYVEVGNVSLTGDFLSKRLMFTFVEKKEHFFPFIISGTLLNVPKLLGCVLEQDKDFAVPQSFVVSNWSI